MEKAIKTSKKNNCLEISAETFGKVPDNSIDFAIMEKSKNVAMVPCNIGWSDIGSWNALKNLVDPDENGNYVEGQTLLHDVKNCYIQSRDRMIGALGITDLFIIDTRDALLVVDRKRTQDVKQLYVDLKEKGHETYKFHKKVYRPWGSYTILEEGPHFKIKRLEVKPGASLSLQMHYHRSEHWIVVTGTAEVINGDSIYTIHTNESTFIPACHKHRLHNPTLDNLVIIEVQCGNYLGEDDIVRFQDNYSEINT